MQLVDRESRAACHILRQGRLCYAKVRNQHIVFASQSNAECYPKSYNITTGCHSILLIFSRHIRFHLDPTFFRCVLKNKVPGGLACGGVLGTTVAQKPLPTNYLRGRRTK